MRQVLKNTGILALAAALVFGFCVPSVALCELSTHVAFAEEMSTLQLSAEQTGSEQSLEEAIDNAKLQEEDDDSDAIHTQAEQLTFTFITNYVEDTTAPNFREATYESIEIAAGTTVHWIHCDGYEEEFEIDRDIASEKFDGNYYNSPEGYNGEIFTYEKNADGTPKFNADGSFTLTGTPAQKVTSLVRYLAHVTHDDGTETSEKKEIWVSYGNTLTVDSDAPITIDASGKTYEFLNPESLNELRFTAYDVSWNNQNAILTSVEFGHVKSTVTYPDPNGIEQKVEIDTTATYYVDGEAYVLTEDVTLVQNAEPSEGYNTVGFTFEYNDEGEAVFTTKSGTPNQYTIFYSYDIDFWTSSDYGDDGQPITSPKPKATTTQQTYYTGESFDLKNPPSRAEYVFLGWYLSDDGGQTLKAAIAHIDEGTHENIQVYAKWVKVWDAKYVENEEMGRIMPTYTERGVQKDTELPVVITDSDGKALLDNSISAKSDFEVSADYSGGVGYKYDFRIKQFGVNETDAPELLASLIKYGVIQSNIISGNAVQLTKYRINGIGDQSEEEQITSDFGTITLTFKVAKEYKNNYFHVYQFDDTSKNVIDGKTFLKPNDNCEITYTVKTLSTLVLVRGQEIQESDPYNPGPSDGGDTIDPSKIHEVTVNDKPSLEAIDPASVGLRFTPASVRNLDDSEASFAAARTLSASNQDAVKQQGSKKFASASSAGKQEATATSADAEKLAWTGKTSVWIEEHGELALGIALGIIILVFGGGFIIALAIRKANFKKYW